MRYINPKTDFGFKKIFASEESKDILISFLNAIIYDGEPIIEDLEILDPYQPPYAKGGKETYLDVKANLQDGTKVIIEMQILNTEAFEKRVFYNAAKAYSLQLNKGEDYLKINPVIAVTITDFIMFSEFTDYCSSFVLKEEKHLISYRSNDFKLIFVELPKFEKKLEDLTTLAEKWIYFLKSANQLNSIPENLRTITPIDHAFDIARRTNLSQVELDQIIKDEMAIQEQRGMISFAKKQGLQEGLQEGLQQGLRQGLQQGLQEGLQQGLQQGLQEGLQQGLQQGLQEGIKQGQINLIMNLLTHKIGDIPLEITNQIKNLSSEKINQLILDVLTLENIEQISSWLENNI